MSSKPSRPLTRAATRLSATVRSATTAARLLWRGTLLLLGAVPRAGMAFVAIIIILGLLPVGQVWLARVVVDRLSAAGGIALGAILVTATLYALTMLVADGLLPVRDVLADALRDHAMADVDRRLIRAGTQLADLYRIERPAFQDELRVISEVWWHWPNLIWLLQTGVGTTVTLTGVLLLLVPLNPLLPLALALLTIPYAATAQRMHAVRTAALSRRSRAAREMDYCTRIMTEPTAAKEIRVFGVGPFFLQRFHERAVVALREVTRQRMQEMGLEAAFAGLHALALAGGFWYVAVQVAAGRVTIGELALYVTALAQAESRLFMFSRLFFQMQQVLLHLPVLFRFLDEAGPTIALPPPATALLAPVQLRLGNEFRHISFHYPEQTQTAIRDVSALLPAGKVTAVVGANGAGKSTLVKLLTRMYDPTAGDMLFDGQPLASYTLDSLRNRIAVVYQDFAHFALTLGENITVGAADPDSASHLEGSRVERAARWAGADTVAAKLPGGYATELTRQFAGGVDLSGGEWQKVALARAFVRDATLVILDEPTAALDADAEYQLFQQFRALIAGKTALLISHRFSTVQMADHILVLEDGRIIEEGNHDELMALGGRYASLYEMQAGRYR